MTVTSATPRNDYIGSGITGPYPFTFGIQSSSHLKVIKRDLTSGGETTLVLGTDYTMVGSAWPTGGSITLSASLSSAFALALLRVVPLLQQVDLRNQAAFFAEVHEAEFDLLTMADQQQQDAIGRSLQLPQSEAGSSAAITLPAALLRANRGLGFDANGNVTLVNASDVTGVVATATGTKFARALSARFGERRNVLDFGAIGDGSSHPLSNYYGTLAAAQADFPAAVALTDERDWAAIQGAINSLVSGGAPVAVYCPAGTYTINKSLILDVSGITLMGEGRATIIKRANSVAGATMNMIQTSFQGRYAAAPIDSVVIADLTLDVNKAGNTIGGNDNWDNGINGLYCKKTTIFNVEVKNSLRFGIILSTNADHSRVVNCIVRDCDEGGIYTDTCINPTIADNVVINCPANVAFNMGGITMTSSPGGTVTGNNVYQGRWGIYIRQNCNGIVVVGNSINGTVSHGIYATDESQTTNYITDSVICDNAVKDAGGDGIKINLGRNLTINGNNVRAATTVGINIDHTNVITVIGNKVTSTGTNISFDSVNDACVVGNQANFATTTACTKLNIDSNDGTVTIDAATTDYLSLVRFGAGTRQITGQLFARAIGTYTPASVVLAIMEPGGSTRAYFRQDGTLDIAVVGSGLRVAEGANAKQGLTGAMTAGTLVVANTSITANSRIIVTRQPGGTNPGAVYVSAISVGVSFTITSTNGADTGAAAFQIFEPG